MILVTGSAGFIGSCLIKELITKFKVVGIDDLSSGTKKNIIKHKNYRFIKGDCGNLKLLNKIKNIKIIIHLAGQSSGEKSFEDPLNDFVKNTQSSINLIEFAKQKKCTQFIFASSMSVYGDNNKIKVHEKLKTNPISFYGMSKEFSEKYIIKHAEKNINYTILRFFNVYGSQQKLGNLKQGMLRIYLSQIFNNKSLIVKGSGDRFRDFIHISDVLKYIKMIINNKKFYNQIFNIGTGEKIKIKYIVKLIQKKISFKFKVKYVEGTKDDQFGIVSNSDKIEKFTKINKYIKLSEGLDEMIKNIK